MLLYPTFIPNQNSYNMLGIKLGIKIKNFRFSYTVSSFPFSFCGIGFSVSSPATFSFITSNFAFRDTLSAGASAYCLMPLSGSVHHQQCKQSTHSSVAVSSCQDKSQKFFRKTFHPLQLTLQPFFCAHSASVS